LIRDNCAQRYVIEVPKGWAKRHGIVAVDTIPGGQSLQTPNLVEKGRDQGTHTDSKEDFSKEVSAIVGDLSDLPVMQRYTAMDVANFGASVDEVKQAVADGVYVVEGWWSLFGGKLRGLVEW
jgi:hypothetical protein